MSTNATVVAAGKICALALAVLVAPAADRAGPGAARTASGPPATSPAASPAPACRTAWPSAPCTGEAPARRVRVIAIGPAGPLPR